MLWPRIAYGTLGDPWREMRRLQREVNSLFDGRGPGAPAEYPAVNVYASGDGALVTAELPGMEPGDIDISVEGNTLTVRGARKAVEVKEGMAVHRRERGTGGFARSVQLPFRADPETVDAKYDRGVLRVSLEAIPQEKPRKIAVKTA